jgi:hypothetical protein
MIFCPIGEKNYECLNAVNSTDYSVYRSLSGTSQKATWKPLVVRCVRADKRQKQLVSDFPWLGGVLVFREKAVDALKDMLETHGELLPIIIEDGVTLYIHNTFVLPNALDEERSTITRFEGTKRIMWIKKTVFHEDVVRGVDIFRLPTQIEWNICI